MLNLNDREWKGFSHDMIFTNYHGKRLTKEKREIGLLPMLTASESNQGVSSFINNSSMVIFDDCITIDMFGHAFYHDYKCTGDDNIYFFKNNAISGRAKKFIASCINNNRIKFSYGKQFRQRNADKEIVMLPVGLDGQPDYDFMEAYVREQEQQKIQSYLDYCTKQLQELGSLVSIDEIEDKDWKEFFVSDIFDIPKRGKRIISDNYADGNMAVVSSAGGNNGVIAFAGNTEKVRIYGNCLSVANGGVSAGFAFYHPYDFIATDHITHFKGDSLNKYHYLFLAAIIKNQMHEKYDFSREMTDPRLQREKVIVPVDSEGKPDYDYMEQYAKNLMIKKYQSYLDFLKKADKDVL